MKKLKILLLRTRMNMVQSQLKRKEHFIYTLFYTSKDQPPKVITDIIEEEAEDLRNHLYNLRIKLSKLTS